MTPDTVKIFLKATVFHLSDQQLINKIEIHLAVETNPNSNNLPKSANQLQVV